MTYLSKYVDYQLNHRTHKLNINTWTWQLVERYSFIGNRIELWTTDSNEDKPSDSLASLAKCDPHAFPTIHRLLLVFATQPVTTSTAERTFSTLRRLKTWLRSTIKEDRLTGLALMAMNKNRFSMDDAHCVLDKFASKKARRLNLLLD